MKLQLEEVIEYARSVEAECSDSNVECSVWCGQIAGWLEELAKVREILGDTYGPELLRKMLEADNVKNRKHFQTVYCESIERKLADAKGCMERAFDVAWQQDNQIPIAQGNVRLHQALQAIMSILLEELATPTTR